MSSLRRSHAIFAVLKKGAMLIFPALHRGHASTLQIIDVSSKQGPCCFSSKKTVCTCRPCTKGHAKFLCAIKNVQLIPCRRENLHSCAGSPTISSTFRGRRAVEGSSVSPLTNTMGGLSGGGRGGDTSGVCLCPFIRHRRVSCPSFGLGFGLWHLLSSLRQ